MHAALATAQLQKLGECQRQLMATLSKEKLDERRAKELEGVFSRIPEYTRKLDLIAGQMNAISSRTASMRMRSAQLAAEHLTTDAKKNFNLQSNAFLAPATDLNQ